MVVATLEPDHTPDHVVGEDHGCWWPLVRRNRGTGELTFYRCYAPQIVPLRELVRVAGRRWIIEESFRAAKGLAGLDEHQVRCWTSWRRWTLLAMVATDEHADRPAPTGLVALTCNDVTNTAPEPATTRAKKQPGRGHSDLRLEY